MASAAEATVRVSLDEEATKQFDQFIESLAETMRKADEWYRDQLNLRDLIREEVRAALAERFPEGDAGELPDGILMPGTETRG